VDIRTIYEFIEPTCPYCRYVYIYILKDLMVKRVELNQKMSQMGIKKYIPPFDIKLIDIIANRGCREEQWFNWYSHKIGGRYTPVVCINDVGFYLWGGDKPSELEEKQLSRTDKLKSDIISELTEEYFEKKPVLYDKNLMNSSRGGI
jgi:glutaredoxin